MGGGGSASRRVCIQGVGQTPLAVEPPGHVTYDACWDITLAQTSFAGSNEARKKPDPIIYSE